jgi:hypothetical protein
MAVLERFGDLLDADRHVPLSDVAGFRKPLVKSGALHELLDQVDLLLGLKVLHLARAKNTAKRSVRTQDNLTGRSAFERARSTERVLYQVTAVGVPNLLKDFDLGVNKLPYFARYRGVVS